MSQVTNRLRLSDLTSTTMPGKACEPGCQIAHPAQPIAATTKTPAHRLAATRFLLHVLWSIWIVLLAIFLIRVFLSHWSLLDGSARNGFGAYLQGTAHKPFAYRWLVPWTIQHLGGWLPENLKSWLGGDIAQLLYQSFVAPLLEKYGPLLPGLTATARADWNLPAYRLNYTIMVALLWMAAAAALTLIGRISLLLGNTSAQACVLMLAYALIYPSVFLHAGYFYDFFEQAFVLLAIYCVLRQRWRTFAAVLVIMQCNRETALFLPVLLAPLIHAQIHARRNKIEPLAWLSLAMVACFAIYQASKLFFAGNPGASFEFHLFQNLAFWRDPATWTATYDTYAVGLELPRLLFLIYFVPLFIFSLKGPRNPMAWSACLCVAVMTALFIAVGYRDEFRAMGICLPFTLVAVAGRLSGWQAPGHGTARRTADGLSLQAGARSGIYPITSSEKMRQWPPAVLRQYWRSGRPSA